MENILLSCDQQHFDSHVLIFSYRTPAFQKMPSETDVAPWCYKWDRIDGLGLERKYPGGSVLKVPVVLTIVITQLCELSNVVDLTCVGKRWQFS